MDSGNAQIPGSVTAAPTSAKLSRASTSAASFWKSASSGKRVTIASVSFNRLVERQAPPGAVARPRRDGRRYRAPAGGRRTPGGDGQPNRCRPGTLVDRRQGRIAPLADGHRQALGTRHNGVDRGEIARGCDSEGAGRQPSRLTQRRARVCPDIEPFLAVSMYSLWSRPHASAGSSWILADASAHRGSISPPAPRPHRARCTARRARGHSSRLAG